MIRGRWRTGEFSHRNRAPTASCPNTTRSVLLNALPKSPTVLRSTAQSFAGRQKPTKLAKLKSARPMSAEERTTDFKRDVGRVAVHLGAGSQSFP